MPYHDTFADKLRVLNEWIDHKHELGADVSGCLAAIARSLDDATAKVAALPDDPALAAREPDALDAIRSLRPDGPRRLPLTLSPEVLRDRILGAWLARAAGNMLGVPCEGFSREDIRSACDALGLAYPLRDYWPIDPKTTVATSETCGLPRRRFLRDHIQYIMPDDDLAYTLLGLLIFEERGPGFTPADVGQAWLRYLPFACTAEKAALDNLRRGLRPPETARTDNPDCEWIGADIRSDPWGYVAPGLPELAAEFAWRDAVVSHRRNGIYGEMYFSAVIAAALATGDVRRSLEIGLTEIPAACRLAESIRRAFEWCDKDDDFDRTLDRILDAHRGMHVGHTINCAAITVAGLLYGREDVEETLSLVVSAGLDTDCTGATAGSIVGAVHGAAKLPPKWVRPLGRVVRTYLTGRYVWDSEDIADRFARLAQQTRRRADTGEHGGAGQS